MAEDPLATARAWMRDSGIAHPDLAALVRELGELFRGNRYGWERRYPLRDLTPADVEQLLLHQIGKYLILDDPDGAMDALVDLLIWAAKHGRIADRKVEYRCRELRAEAQRRLRFGGSTTKQIAQAAREDGVDITDVAAVRAHAIARGLSPSYIDAFWP